MTFMEFYTKYLANDNAKYRKELINNLIKNRQCQCYDKLKLRL